MTKYLVRKADHYLVDVSYCSSTWLNNPTKALPFSDAETAGAIAEAHDAYVVISSDNVN